MVILTAVTPIVAEASRDLSSILIPGYVPATDIAATIICLDPHDVSRVPASHTDLNCVFVDDLRVVLLAASFIPLARILLHFYSF